MFYHSLVFSLVTTIKLKKTSHNYAFKNAMIYTHKKESISMLIIAVFVVTLLAIKIK